MKFGTVQFGIFLFLLIGCNSPERNSKSINLYFDVKGVIDYQRRKFSISMPKIEKTAAINGSESKTEVSAIDWKKELDLFEAININKPIFNGVFKSFAYVEGSGIVNYYFKKKDTKSNIQYLRVVFTETNKLVSLEGLDKTKNPVFSSQKRYLMYFDTTNLQLTSYKLSGSQGFLFFAKDTFDIKAVVLK
jgi:hypothetical protein